MSELLQFIIVAAFGAFCFGCGYLTAFDPTETLTAQGGPRHRRPRNKRRYAA